jgi:hypothetical protein
MAKTTRGKSKARTKQVDTFRHAASTRVNDPAAEPCACARSWVNLGGVGAHSRPARVALAGEKFYTQKQIRPMAVSPLTDPERAPIPWGFFSAEAFWASPCQAEAPV